MVIRLGRFIKIRVKANAFLYHMVRNIVGCLVYVGTGARSVDWMGEVLEAKSRQAAAPTFYPTGLYLTGVGYPEIFGLPQHGASPFPGIDKFLLTNSMSLSSCRAAGFD